MTKKINQQDRIAEVEKIIWEYKDPLRSEVAHEIDDYYSQLFPQPLTDEELRGKITSLRFTREDMSALYGFGFLTKQGVDKALALLQPKIEQERERIGLIIDSHMAHGKYKVLLDGVLVNGCLSADMENVWEQIKEALKKGESK